MMNKSAIVTRAGRRSEALPELPDIFRPARPSSYPPDAAGGGVHQIAAEMQEFYRRGPDRKPSAEMDLNRVVEEVSEFTRPCWDTLPRRAGLLIQMQHELEPGLPRMSGDPLEFREALMNLICNAADALPQGGIITLITRSVGDEGGISGRRIQVEVRDNGLGMNEQTQRRCLEPFFSARPRGGGLGLGLTMVQGLTQHHGGIIEIDSAPGCGTCVRLTFPVRTKNHQPGGAPASN